MTQSLPLRIGIIGGSGLGDALGAEDGQAVNVDTPFGPTSSPIVQARWHGVDIAILQRHGHGHRYNPAAIPVRANLYALKSLGVTHIIASGATGSLRENIHPGDLVIVDQLIDKTSGRPHTFYEYAAVHVEFSEPFCPVMRKWLLAAAARLEGFQGTVHDRGTYICMEGPAFSTRAESNMHRAWGGDLIGMTAMPEAKLAREAEIAYAMIGLPTDYDCWRHTPKEVAQHELLKEIIGNLQRASAAGVNLIKAALTDVAPLRKNPSPAHNALALALWTHKAVIDPAEIQRLSVLWGKYF